MIESRFWKEEISRIERSIRPVSKPARFSVRRLCVVERDLHLAFFMVRKMLEMEKLSSSVAQTLVSVGKALCRGGRVHRLNNGWIEDLYDIENGVSDQVPLFVMCNHFVHSRMSRLFRGEDRNWSDVWLVSDWKRNEFIFQVEFSEISRVLQLVAEDGGGDAVCIRWSKGDQDYVRCEP